jgi:hypothetical protein
MTKLGRIQVYFNLKNTSHKERFDELKRLAEERGISDSELVRELLLTQSQFKPYNAESSRRLIEQRLESRPTFRR